MCNKTQPLILPNTSHFVGRDMLATDKSVFLIYDNACDADPEKMATQS